MYFFSKLNLLRNALLLVHRFLFTNVLLLLYNRKANSLSLLHLTKAHCPGLENTCGTPKKKKKKEQFEILIE